MTIHSVKIKINKPVDWSSVKNTWLKVNRSICFQDIYQAILLDQVIDIIKHPNKQKYPSQKIIIVNIAGYIYLVPFVEDEKKIFLKTIYASRKLNKKYNKK